MKLLLTLTFAVMASPLFAFDIEPAQPDSCDTIYMIAEQRFTEDCDWVVVPTIGVFGSRISIQLEPKRGSEVCADVEVELAFEFSIGRLPPGNYDVSVFWTDTQKIERGNIEIRDGSCGAGFLRGDPNADGEMNISDAITTVSHLFLGGANVPCLEAADTDSDGQLQITDAIYGINWLFLSGPPPLAPFPDCGAPEDFLIGCDRPHCETGVETYFVSRPDGCIQCGECLEPDIESVVTQLERDGHDIRGFFIASDNGVCEACDCPSGRNYVVEVLAEGREALLENGWRDWSWGDRGVGIPLRFEEVARGEFSEFPVGVTFVRSAEQQKALGISVEGRIDYEAEMLVLVAEAHNQGGHYLRIDRMLRYEREIEILYTRSRPSEDCGTHDGIPRPYHIVRCSTAQGVPFLVPKTVYICCGQSMRIAGVGACRRLPLGVYWDGDSCEWLSACECVGEDCDNLFSSVEECEQTYSVCPDRE